MNKTRRAKFLNQVERILFHDMGVKSEEVTFILRVLERLLIAKNRWWIVG